MYIIADSRMPNEAKFNLEKIGTVLWMESENNTYPAIACHPDIFFCQIDNDLIVAKNAPLKVIKQLEKIGIKLTVGALEVGNKYPESAYYNTLITNDFVIRNTKIHNPIFNQFEQNRKTIHVSQGYTRCNLIHLKENSFITSDKGILNELIKNNLNVLFIQSEEIILENINHGFFGGCCGVFEDTLYIIGSLKYHIQGELIKAFVKQCHFKVIELYDGKLWDGGGLLFVK